jgi:hypothetical protein
VDKDILPFFSEVRVLSVPEWVELEGLIGAVLGVSGEPDVNGEYHYAVQLDRYDDVVSFRGSQLAPTGSIRNRSDYY